MTNRRQKCGQRTAICHFSLVIFHWSFAKCIAGFQPAKVVLTQKELSRLRCRRDAGATIFSHDLWLRGKTEYRINREDTKSARDSPRIWLKEEGISGTIEGAGGLGSHLQI